MGRYLVIEGELKLRDIIKKSVLQLDSQAQFNVYESFEDFNLSFKELGEAEQKDIQECQLIVLDIGEIPIKEWQKILGDFRAKINPDAVICLTGYEVSGLTHRFLQQLPVYNFIFKPFDALILKETLNFSLHAGEKSKTLEIKSSQQTSGFVGILKDIELQAISELGFITLSDVQIPIGSVSKYLTQLFESTKKESLSAQCIASVPQKEGTFVNQFQYYAIETEMLNPIRKYIQSRKKDGIANGMWGLGVPGSSTQIKVAIIASENEQNQQYKTLLEKQFKNVTAEFIHFVKKGIFEHDVVINLSEINCEDLKKSFKKAKAFFLISADRIEDDRLKAHALCYSDVFLAPIDRSYFCKKLKVHVKDIEFSEPFTLLNISCHEKIKAANTLKVTEVNELSLSFDYPRQLSYKDIRTFVFLNSEENQIVEVPGFCHFIGKNTAPLGRPPNYSHQFAFLGMTDHYLREIRLWLLHNHISKKKF